MHARVELLPPAPNSQRMTHSRTFIPTRTAALTALNRFLPNAGREYAQRRNYDLGPDHSSAVSTLSPWIRSRVLTEQEVLDAVLEHHTLQEGDKFIQEVFWRTYWKGWLELRPSVWDTYQRDLTRAWNEVQTQSGLRDRWAAACSGETDIACFDAWARELVTTGYLHNHARMWFASIWIFTLKLPWELGADFFLRHLLDGDAASNTLSWRWVGGIQTPGKTYLARTSNIAKFTNDRFHPKWQLASEAIPLNAPPLPEPRHLPDPGAPDADLRSGFLLHEEDLSPGFAHDGVSITHTCILSAQTSQTPLHMADNVLAFRNNCLADCAHLLARTLPCPATLADSAQEVLDWAENNGIQQIITPFAPTGPVSKVLTAIAKKTNAPRIVQIMRAYDRAAWPHATKGFFRFKKQIPALLQPHA